MDVASSSWLTSVISTGSPRRSTTGGPGEATRADAVPPVTSMPAGVRPSAEPPLIVIVS